MSQDVFECHTDHFNIFGDFQSDFCDTFCHETLLTLCIFQKQSFKMTEAAGNQKNTAYGVFVQACWAQHKRQYPDELIHKEIEEFNKQCSVWWYNLSEQERDRFQVRMRH